MDMDPQDPPVRVNLASSLNGSAGQQKIFPINQDIDCASHLSTRLTGPVKLIIIKLWPTNSINDEEGKKKCCETNISQKGEVKTNTPELLLQVTSIHYWRMASRITAVCCISPFVWFILLVCCTGLEPSRFIHITNKWQSHAGNRGSGLSM